MSKPLGNDSYMPFDASTQSVAEGQSGAGVDGMHQNDDEALLHRLELRLLNADARASAVELAGLLADEFVEFGSSGSVWDRAQTIAGLVTERGSGPAAGRNAHEVRVRLLAEGVALVTYRVVRRQPNDGSEIHSRRSSVWLRDGGGQWRLLFHQGTLTRPER